MWCAASRKLQRTVNIGSKARCVGYSPDGGEIAVGCKNGGVHVLDAKSLIRVKWMKTLNEYVTDVKFSPDGTLLAAASADQRIDVYERKSGYKKIATCRGHSATVRHVDWCAQSKILRTVCGAYEILYFDGRTGRPVTANQRDTKWATWTSVLGFDVMGIWRDGFDGTDINAVDISEAAGAPDDKTLVVVADDDGGVSLYNYPCVVTRAAPARRRPLVARHECALARRRRALRVGWRPRPRRLPVAADTRAVAARRYLLLPKLIEYTTLKNGTNTGRQAPSPVLQLLVEV